MWLSVCGLLQLMTLIVSTSHSSCSSVKCLFAPERCSVSWSWLVALMSMGKPFEWLLLVQFFVLKNCANLLRLTHVCHKKRRARVLLFLRTDKGLVQELGFRGSWSFSVETPITSRPSPALHPFEWSYDGGLFRPSQWLNLKLSLLTLFRKIRPS